MPIPKSWAATSNEQRVRVEVFSKDQRHVFAAQRIVGNARLFLGFQLGRQVQQITDFRRGKVQQRQKSCPTRSIVKLLFKYTVYLYKYTYIITFGDDMQAGFCGIIKKIPGGLPRLFAVERW